jgi:hypothetical protein
MAGREPDLEREVDRPQSAPVRAATLAIERARERQAGLDNDRIDQARDRIEQARRRGGR